jgi:gliding motility-associated-like protein
MPCSVACTTLTATPFHVGSTSTYTVASVPYAPVLPYNQAGGTQVVVNGDDVYSPVVNLPFPFCFYGNTYTQCVVGSNGTIRFNPALANGYCPWFFTANCPSNTLPLNSIFGIYMDLLPIAGGQVKWHLIGTAPCRMLVVNFNQVAEYSCTAMRVNSQFVLYETTNVIEVYTNAKPLCAGWNGGRAIIGIQNATGTVGLAAPGRNTTPTWVPAAAGEGWRFTPNGAPTYTVTWWQGATQIGTGNSVNVCPATYPATYTAQIQYTRCDGLLITDTDPVTLTQNSLAAPTVTPTAETCDGYNNGSVVVNNAPGVGPFTVTITGPANPPAVVEPNTAAGTATFSNLPDGTYNYTVVAANGCQVTGTFTINPGPVCCSVTAAGTNVTCGGGANGTATANPVGMPGFTYSWNSTPVQTGQTATGLPAGTYTVTITDASGCIATANYVVTQPTALSGTATPTNVLCNGQCTGSISVAAAGGTGALQYSLNGGAFQASNTFGGLCAGAYTITVRDASNCTFTINTTITQPTALSGSITTNIPATCGLNNGSLTAAGAGGTTTYQYSLNGGAFQASGTFNGLAPGAYTITVRDANNCTTTLNATIASQPSPTATVGTQTNVSCFGGANGSVVITGLGGTGSLSYDLNPGPTQASNTFTNLTAGAYSVTVTDGNSCTSTVNFTITQPTQVTLSTVKTNATCNGVCDGTITVTSGGGTPPYQYSSNGGLTYQASNVLTGLCAGTYSVVTQDANGCIANVNVVITQPTAVSGTFTGTDPVCNNACDGTVVATTASGGTAPYQYSINGGAMQASTNFSGLCAGIYAMITQDANGCQFTTNVTLTNPPGYNLDTVYMDESNCGFNDGGFQVVATGGAGSYQYTNLTTADGPNTTGEFLNLVAGAYQVLVEDALGCHETLFVGVNDVQMSGALLGQTDPTCPGACDGTVITTATGGFGTITYDLDNGVQTQFGAGNFSNICDGSHAVVMTDQGFCVYVAMFTLTAPDNIIYTSSKTDPTCNGGTNGTITFTAPTGGTAPYQYSIDGGLTYQASPNFTGVAAGTYNLMVMDANNCTQANTITVTEPTPVTFSESHTNLTCNANNTGTLTLVGAGGTPGAGYTYSITGAAPLSAQFAYFGLAANTYNIIVADGNGCQTTGSVVITQPAPVAAIYTTTAALCNGSCDGEIFVQATGGTQPYFFSPDNGVTFSPDSTLIGLCAGNHTVVVKDVNNCQISAVQIITEPTAVTYSAVVTPSTCGNPNGVIDITANGGTPGFTYSTDGGATFVAGNNFSGLAANTYAIDVQDNNGCHVTGSEIVANQASPVINSLFATNLLCNAVCDGSIVATASGGTGALTFDIGGAGQAGGTFAALCAGTYTLTVTDANGCQDTQTATLTEPTQLTFTTTPTPLSCFGDGSGSIAFNANGGVPTYLYSIDNGASFSSMATVSFLQSGLYDVVVEDANGCQSAAQVNVTEPAQLIITNQTATNASCFGVCDGTVDVQVSGGTTGAGLYTYNWANGIAGPNQNNVTGLCAGSYPVDIIDNNGCSVSTTLSVTQPPQVIINNYNVTDVTCNADCDGVIEIFGINTVQYSIDNGATFQAASLFNNLCAGIYNIVVEDAAGCQATTAATIVEPNPLVLDTIADVVVCYNGFGTMIGNASGGTAPYYFVWNTGDTTQYLNFQTTVPVTNTAYAVDQNGCVSNSESASASVLPVFVPSNSGDIQICQGDPAIFTAGGIDGVPAYNFIWFYGNDTLIDSDTLIFTPTQPMQVMLVASDQCPTYDTSYLNVTFYAPPQPNISVSPASGCAPLTVTITNTTPANQVGADCTWDFGDGNTATGCGTQTNIYTVPDCYSITLTVTSPEGCVGDSTFTDVVCVFGDPIADFTWNPETPTILNTVVNFVDQSVNGNTYAWDFAGLGTSTDQNPTFNFVNADTGQYQVCLTVTSPQGCVDDTCKMVTIFDEFLVYVPNAFSPNDDGFNDIFIPVLNGADPLHYEFLVFNRWGELIFESQVPANGWDGTFKNQMSQQDVYVWRVKARSILTGEEKLYFGHVTLLK